MFGKNFCQVLIVVYFFSLMIGMILMQASPEECSF